MATKKVAKKWYRTRQPDTKIFQEYDFARNAGQAKGMLRDLRGCGAVAQKTARTAGVIRFMLKKDLPAGDNPAWRQTGT